MTGDRSDAIVLTYRANGSGTRYVFEPQSNGQYLMVEKTLTKGGDWRPVGDKVVDSVAVETP